MKELFLLIKTYDLKKNLAAVAQLVEQRTENPCVRSSILLGGIIYKLKIFVCNVAKI